MVRRDAPAAARLVGENIAQAAEELAIDLMEAGWGYNP